MYCSAEPRFLVTCRVHRIGLRYFSENSLWVRLNGRTSTCDIITLRRIEFTVYFCFLGKQQEIKYGSLRNGTTSAFFEKSNVTVFQQMWATMQKRSSEVFVATNDEGVAKVRNPKEKYAFFIE